MGKVVTAFLRPVCINRRFVTRDFEETLCSFRRAHRGVSSMSVSWDRVIVLEYIFSPSNTKSPRRRRLRFFASWSSSWSSSSSLEAVERRVKKISVAFAVARRAVASTASS